MANRNQILLALRQHAEGQIAKHKTNVDIYLNNTTGIGEHSDIVETIEKELNHIGKYKEQLDVLKTYFEN
tara:strand:+ start:80 stop:289 length:210 start_codon:yes stop_codon:yes gene_type:complete